MATTVEKFSFVFQLLLFLFSSSCLMLLFLQGCLPLVSQQLCWVGDLSKVIILCALWLITIETTVPLFLSPTRLSLHYAASLLDKRVCALSIQLHDRHKCNRNMAVNHQGQQAGFCMPVAQFLNSRSLCQKETWRP